MKRLSTTPVSSSFAKRAVIMAATVLLIVASAIQFMPTARADRYDEQIAALQREIDQYEAQARKFQNQANNIQQKLQGLTLQKRHIQSQIDISEAKYNKLQQQIKETEQKIADNREALGETIADLYIEGKTSPLEMLASSSTIGDYIDKQEYQSSIRDQLTSTIKEIKSLKEKLEIQKKDVERVLADQKNSRKALAAKEAEQQSILAATKGQQSAYEQLSAKQKAEQSQIREAQQAAIAARIASTGGATVIASGADGAYPWNDSNCRMVGYFSTGGADGNGGDGYGYGCRQCASYGAWRVAKETGYYPVNWGNATNFPASARSAGYKTGYTPRAGSLAVMHAFSAGVPEGHTGWVEAVVDGGASIIVSQYNYNYGAGYGMYSKMKMSASAFDEYVYIK
ncbi:TPA: CHAP domain-containing protein [Candidatus Saccharibacteria bacterium]|nr:CHAP domain-containing protein [Candidatus Saccharibacteria bacterium]